jgi:hypothetical protein
MSTECAVHVIQFRSPGMPRYPMGRWIVVFSDGHMPMYCDTLNEAKGVAEREGGVTRWRREQRDGYVAYWPMPPAPKEHP